VETRCPEDRGVFTEFRHFTQFQYDITIGSIFSAAQPWSPHPLPVTTPNAVYGPDFMIEVLIVDCLIHSNMLTTCIYLASNISSNRLEFMLFYCQPLEYSVSITDQSNVDSWYENTSCQFQYNVFCGKDSTIHPHRSVTWQCFVIPLPLVTFILYVTIVQAPPTGTPWMSHILCTARYCTFTSLLLKVNHGQWHLVEHVSCIANENKILDISLIGYLYICLISYFVNILYIHQIHALYDFIPTRQNVFWIKIIENSFKDF
jgi:hypothetical protein